MPNLVTHYLCGLEATKKIENVKCKNLIAKYQQVFNLGLQGPDILFYYEVWPWTKKTIKPNIGQIMHTSKVNKVFKSLIEYIVKQKDSAKEILTVYLMGFVSHNCMDSIGHPYIFYRSGFTSPSNNNENLFLYYHRRFEVSIDVLLCQKLLDKKVYEIDCDKLIEVSDAEINLLSDLYEHIIDEVFNQNAEKKKIKRSIKETLFVEKLLKDPTGIKKKIVGFLDKTIYGFPLFSSLIFPLKLDDGIDYLNVSNREWYMPFDKEIKSTKSFMDLFHEACHKSQRYCEVLFSAIFNDNSSIPYTLKLLGNNSYTSGVDCDTPVVFKYSDIVFNRT